MKASERLCWWCTAWKVLWTRWQLHDTKQPTSVMLSHYNKGRNHCILSLVLCTFIKQHGWKKMTSSLKLNKHSLMEWGEKRRYTTVFNTRGSNRRCRMAAWKCNHIFCVYKLTYWMQSVVLQKILAKETKAGSEVNVEMASGCRHTRKLWKYFLHKTN